MKRLGVSIIEVVVYIGLLVLIMGSSILILFQIIESSSRLQKAILIQQESLFLFEKINASLVYGATITAPPQGTQGEILTIIPPKNPFNAIIFYRTGSTLWIRRGTNAPQPLNAQDAPLTALTFHHLAATATSSQMITITMTIDNTSFSQTHILLP